ncbi:MAG: cellulase family glycosylhydrolase [Anaerolineales bacterium]|jgi:hypothetical protein
MIRADGSWFKDELGRTLILRGVNLGGSTKVPFHPNGATHLRAGFLDHRNVSFVGRPFLLEVADEHFDRLKRWGFTLLRFLVTWEAIEHAGPDLYDEAYLDFVRAVIKKAAGHGFQVFIDPHQDVWSRFSGGDGAPGWTLEAVGFDLAQLHASGAAIVHQMYGDPFPRMVWPTNATRLASATMFTLFFGGKTFAPATQIAGEPAQDYLQRHYIQSLCQLAQRLRDLPNVIGYDTLNEPSAGWIGWRDLTSSAGAIRYGLSPSPLQSMALGEGIPCQVQEWAVGLTGSRRRKLHWVNQDRARAWQAGHKCAWRENGVWDLDGKGQPTLLRPEHFSKIEGRPVSFARNFLLPFARQYSTALRAAHPGALILFEGEPGHSPPTWDDEDRDGLAYGPHWYDGFVLFTKTFSPHLAVDERTSGLIVGSGCIRRSFNAQLARPRREAERLLGGVPSLVGEVGVPLDLDRGRAYRTGDFRRQVEAADRTCRSLEANLLSYTWWNYTADNSNAWGDQWNGEDFSIFSPDQRTDPADAFSGGRALKAIVRPYARAIAGEPIRMEFNLAKREFNLVYRSGQPGTGPTEIFVPALHFPQGYRVEVSDGDFEIHPETSLLMYRHDPTRAIHSMRLTAE